MLEDGWEETAAFHLKGIEMQGMGLGEWMDKVRTEFIDVTLQEGWEEGKVVSKLNKGYLEMWKYIEKLEDAHRLGFGVFPH
jgi:hypothetical protein